MVGEEDTPDVAAAGEDADAADDVEEAAWVDSAAAGPDDGVDVGGVGAVGADP